MTIQSRNRLKRLMALMVCLLAITSLMAQDAPTELPATDPTPEATASASPEVPANVPTAEATQVVIVTEATLPTQVETTSEPTVVPSEEPVIIVTVPPTIVTAAPVIVGTFAPEPPLTLILRDLFTEAALPAHWAFPMGWSWTATADGGAVEINAANAGASSRANLNQEYGNAVVMGYFTFSESPSSAQVIARESASGAYIAVLNASGIVTLEKTDALGTASILGTAQTTLPAGAHSLRLSVIGDVVRVSVDDTEYIVVQDAQPLPAGRISLGAVFPVGDSGTSGTLLFDNAFVWQPTSEIVVSAPVTASATEVTATLETPIVIPESTTAPVVVTPQPTPQNGKSTIERPAAVMAGIMSSDNNDFASRTVIAAVPFPDSGDTLSNTTEVDEPAPLCGFNITHTAWYEFTPPAGGAATESFIITTQGSTYDTILSVYTDSNGGAANLADLAPVVGGCSDDVGVSMQSQVTVTLDDTLTYYIQLGSYNGSMGSAKFTLLRPQDLTVPGVPLVSASNGSAPTAPVANAGKTNLLQPVLAWNASGAAVPYAYDVQVSVSTSFTTPLLSGLTLEPTRFFQITPALPEPPLAAGKIYYWHVRARNVMGQASAWSATYSFTLDRVAPLPPALTTPTLNGVVTSTRPAFKWAASAGASGYHLRVASNFSCTMLVSPDFDINVTTLTHTFAAQLPQGEYWYCLTARDLAGNESPYSEKRRFVVNISLTPANKAVVIPVKPATTANLKFTWATVPNAANYTIELADDSSFSATVLSQTVTTTTATFTARPYGTYYWRVAPDGVGLPMSLAFSVTVSPVLPVAPVIQTVGPLSGAVANAGFTNDTTPIFDWTVPGNWVTLPVAQSLTYELQLSTNKTFTPLSLVAPTISGIAASDLEWTATTLADTTGTVYYWRVRAMTNLGLFSAYSAIYSFTLDTDKPNPPTTLTAPLDNATVSTARPAFSWATEPGVNRYIFELTQDNSDFDPLVFPEVTVTKPTYTLPALPATSPYLQQGQYYWRVWSKDAAGNVSAAASPVRALIVNYALKPLNNAIIVSTVPAIHVKLDWAAFPGTATNTIVIEIDNNNDFSSPERTSPVLARTVITYTTSMAGSLPDTTPLPYGKYYWRILVNEHAVMPPALAWSFSISPTVPTAPVLSAVTPKAVTNDTTPDFAWNAVTSSAGASVTGYELQLSNVTTFATLVDGVSVNIAGGSTTSYAWTPPLPATTGKSYYARLRAVTDLGAKSLWSATRGFTLDTVSPVLAPTLIAPANNLVVTTRKPTFQWGGVTGSARYEIVYGPSSDLSAITPISVTTLTHIPPADLALANYYWQVRAVDAAGNAGPWSTQRLLKITSGTGIAPFVWNIADNTPTLTWTALQWADSYHIQVSRNNAFTNIVWEDAAVGINAMPAATVGLTLPNGVYYWRVRAKLPVFSGGQYGVFSDGSSFNVEAP